MSEFLYSRRIPALVGVVALLLAACASPTVTSSPTASTTTSAAPTAPPPSTSPSVPGPTASTASASTTTGFAFAADDVVAYYETQGYTCAAQQPSTKAAGFFVRSCHKVDATGRDLVIGVVTDPGGDLANGFASVQAVDTGSVLDPVDALGPLAGFLGAMLGENQGAALLTWLGGHLGDAYAETTAGSIKVATYSESDQDHSKLYVEVANQAYLDAPAP